MAIDKIITHPGRSHFDEFLAIGMLLAEEGSIETPVFRREPTGEEIDNAEVAVVDIGEEYNPELRLFDHHQDPGLPSSMGLVAEHLGLGSAMRKAFEWFEFKDTLDRQGPKAAAEACGIEGDIRPTQSPVEAYILRSFSGQEGEVARPLVKFMEGLARSVMDRAREFGWKLEEAKEEGALLDMSGRMVYVRPDEEPDSQVLRTLREEWGFVATVTKDPRSDGVSLYTYENTRLDFAGADEQVEGADFAHKAGFLAVAQDVGAARDVMRWAVDKIS